MAKEKAVLFIWVDSSTIPSLLFDSEAHTYKINHMANNEERVKCIKDVKRVIESDNNL